MILETIQSSADVKNLSSQELKTLAQEVRAEIIRVISQNGGHVAPNLGVVELTIALHKIFDVPADNIVFDVSHQCYTHKLLTGRAKNFDSLRKTGGISGFCKRSESASDAFGAGHAGTAISAAIGLAAARDRLGGNEHIVAVVGDAALTNGTSLEALNVLAETTSRLIVVLNDNERSIGKNVGACAEYLNRIIMTPTYNNLTRGLRKIIEKLPFGKQIVAAGSQFKQGNKSMATHGESSLFEHLKLRYLGPVDGHNIDELCRFLAFAKTMDKPILLHVRTKKGCGYVPAMEDPERFHGCGAFDPATGTPKIPSVPANKSWQKIFGETLVKLAANDKKIVGITAAMATGTSLDLLKKAFPQQYFDVGIAEGHAVVFAAGLAAKGLKPCVAIYSTFMQRAVDMVMHDVCLQNLPVVFCLDRAGLSPQDGATHHGLFDLAMLRALPNLILMQPKDDDELADMLATAFAAQKPCAIRYPRGAAEGVPVKPQPEILPIGKAEIVIDGNAEQGGNALGGDASARRHDLRERDSREREISCGNGIFVWALGSEALKIARTLAEHFAGTTVVNARFCKPLDENLLFDQARRAKLIVTIEDHVVAGGFGSAILEALSSAKICVPVERIGWPDTYISHGTNISEIRAKYHLSNVEIIERIEKLL